MRKIFPPVISCILPCCLLLSLHTQQPKLQPPGHRLKTTRYPVGSAMPGLVSSFIGAYIRYQFFNECYPRNMYKKDSKEYKHHLEKHGTEDTFGYKDFIPLFKTEKNNADKWWELFKNAGTNGNTKFWVLPYL